MIRRYFLIFLLLTACHESSKKSLPHSWQEFNGRDEIISYGQRVRRAVYRAQVPLNWQRINPSDLEPISDTTKPIVSFLLEEGVLATVHSFPTDTFDERIPVIAQVERWRRQLEGSAILLAEAVHGGFAGISLEGKNEKGAVRAWAMQLDMQHYQTLHLLATTVEEEEHYKQMAADYTIKAFGPADRLEKHREEIDLFADSFELIQEIPARN